MTGDMETELEMLSRHRAEAWGECGKAVGSNFTHLILSMFLTADFVALWYFGPEAWAGVSLVMSWMVMIIAHPFLKSHFSKKYMRLANGE